MTRIVSTTAQQHGFGRAPFKWVSGATATERAAARVGHLVVFQVRVAVNQYRHRLEWRQMVYKHGRYVPRVYQWTEEEQQ